MAYIKQNFVDGQILNADSLNYIEAGVEGLYNSLGNIDGLTTATKVGSLVNITPSFDGGAKIDNLVHNLLRYPYSSVSHTANDVTWTDVGDGTVIANGTNTSSAATNFNCRLRTETNGLILSPGEYTVSGCPSGGSNSTYYIQVAQTVDGEHSVLGRDYGNGVTFTLTEETQIQVVLVISSSAAVTNLLFKPQLESGSVVHPYVPYVGYTIDTMGKNLIRYPYYEPEKSSNGIDWTDENGLVIANGSATSNSYFIQRRRAVTGVIDANLMVLPEGTYTLSGCPSGGSTGTYYLQASYSSSSGANTLLGNDLGSGVSFVLTQTTQVQVQAIVVSGYEAVNLTFKPQIEVGSVATDYEPFKCDYFITTNDVDKAYVPTYDGVTNITTYYGITLQVEYGLNRSGSQINQPGYVTRRINEMVAYNQAANEPKLIDSKFGALLHLNPSFDGGAKVEGLVHNLLKYPYSSVSHTASGLTWTDNGDGTVTVTGTAEANKEFNCRTRTEASDKGLILAPGTYTVSGCPSGGSNSTYFIRVGRTVNGSYSEIGRDYGEGFVFTLIESTQIQVQLYIVNGATVTDVLFKPQLEVGSVAHPYVPYAGYEVKSVGKNLLPYPYSDATFTKNGITFTDNGDGTVTVNGTATERVDYKFHDTSSDEYRKVLKKLMGKTVSVSGCPEGGSRTTYLLNWQGFITSGSELVDIGDGNTSAIKNYEGTVQLYIIIYAGCVCDNLVFKPMLTVADEYEDITYEPYHCETFPVTNSTDKVYVPTYDGVTNIFTDYGIDLVAEYGITPNGAQIHRAGYVEEIQNGVAEEFDEHVAMALTKKSFSIATGATVKFVFTGRASAIISLSGTAGTAYADYMINAYGAETSRFHVATLQAGSSITYAVSTTEEAITITNNSSVTVSGVIVALIGSHPTVTTVTA